MARLLTFLAVVLCCRFASAQTQNQLDASPALFTVMAAINAVGYNADLASPSNHPLRRAMREAVEKLNPPSLGPIRKFYESHLQENPQQQLSQYISFGLCLQDPPSFKFRYPDAELPPDVRALAGFETLLKKFYEEARIASLWRQSQQPIEDLLAPYQARIIQDVQQASLYLRNPMSGATYKRFQVFVEPLAAPNIMQTRTYVDDYFVVLTPSPQPPFDFIRRAYLHYLIDPLMLRNAEKLEKKRALIDFTQASPILDDAYKSDFSLLAGMCLVRAVESRLAPSAQRQALVDRAMSEGFILTAYFAEALVGYEKDDRAMRLVAGELIDGIDLAKEDRRIAQIEFTSTRTSRVVRSAVKAAPETPTGIHKALADAEDLYEKRNLSSAKLAYRSVLETAGPNAVHARAYYGLARIAVLEKHPGDAEPLFERALELQPEPAIKAWLHIYLARLALAAAGQPNAGDEEKAALVERAAGQYKLALEVEGASETARASAQKELQAAQSRLKE